MVVFAVFTADHAVSNIEFTRAQFSHCIYTHYSYLVNIAKENTLVTGIESD
jgi:hypothetical protein